MWRLLGHLWPPYACTQILIQAQRYTEYQKITIKTDATDYRGEDYGLELAHSCFLLMEMFPLKRKRKP